MKITVQVKHQFGGGQQKGKRLKHVIRGELSLNEKKRTSLSYLGVCPMMEDTREQGVSLLRGAQDQPRRMAVTQSR